MITSLLFRAAAGQIGARSMIVFVVPPLSKIMEVKKNGKKTTTIIEQLQNRTLIKYKSKK